MTTIHTLHKVTKRGYRASRRRNRRRDEKKWSKR